tara:strand:+ start:253 stop:456 length:204 start_codon:yes stop_codon:yes gene_type:complete
MLALLPIYTKISNSDYQITPSELRQMINDETKGKKFTSEELVLLEVVYSFYKLGYDNRIKERMPASP